MRLFLVNSVVIVWLMTGGWLAAAPAVQSAGPAPVTPASRPLVGLDRPVSPVDFFRHLLALPPAERERALADQSETKRKVLQAKVQEYAKLPEAERETRLQLVELHFHLRPLLELPPDKRPEKLTIIPEKDRAVIEERLRQWDSLPAPMQKDVLDNEMTLHYFLRIESTAPAQRTQILNSLPAASRQSLEEKIEKWRALPAERREKTYEHFNQLFELPPKEKERTLEALSEDERRKMEQSLRTFEKLNPEQRQMCLESFRKFANLTKDERTQFLRNVERWREMTSRERETWRNLVNLLPAQPMPPMPPPAGQKIKPPGHVLLPGAQTGSNPPTAPLRGLDGEK